MKKDPPQSANEKNAQDNIGYENTKKSNDQDSREFKRLQTTNTGHDEGPKENKDDTAGLRSESGKRSLGKESGNKKKE